MVTDPSKFSAQGDGLGLVRVNQTASFNVCAPCAQCEDLGVSITGLFPSIALLVDCVTRTRARVIFNGHFPGKPGLAGPCSLGLPNKGI